MLNEAIEAVEKCEKSVIRIPLMNKGCSLNITFDQTLKKRYASKESIKLGNTEIKDPFVLAEVKAYIRKFINGRLTDAHKNEFLEPSEKTTGENGVKIKSTTLYVKGSTNPKIFITDLEAEALLEIWRDSMQGFNRVKLYEKYTKLYVSKNYAKVLKTNEAGEETTDVYVYDSRKTAVTNDLLKTLEKNG